GFTSNQSTQYICLRDKLWVKSNDDACAPGIDAGALHSLESQNSVDQAGCASGVCAQLLHAHPDSAGQGVDYVENIVAGWLCANRTGRFGGLDFRCCPDQGERGWMSVILEHCFDLTRD